MIRSCSAIISSVRTMTMFAQPKITSTYLATTATTAHLDGSLEELDGNVVLPLETEAVSCDTPGLQRHTVLQTLIIVNNSPE